jgi:hypothetical protein
VTDISKRVAYLESLIQNFNRKKPTAVQLKMIEAALNKPDFKAPKQPLEKVEKSREIITISKDRNQLLNIKQGTNRSFAPRKDTTLKLRKNIIKLYSGKMAAL